MRKFALLTAFASSLLFATVASAQQADAMIGGGTLVSSGSGSCATSGICTAPEKGGFYLSGSGDVVFRKRVGFNIEAAWKAGQGSYLGQPYRPILFAFNGLYQPRLNKKVGADLMGGIGFQTTRFYLPYCTNSFTCNNYTSNNHFLVDIGGGLRYYVRGHIFVRPEAHFYHILNNTDVFSGNNVVRVGASIGYTIGPD